MAISVFDQRLYTLQCPKCRVVEEVPLGLLQRGQHFGCAACGYVHDLGVEPHLTALHREYEIAQEIDHEKRANRETVERIN